jgi:TrkA domain protein
VALSRWLFLPEAGVSIVAILRGDKVIPSPEPTEILRQDDIFVAVGTRTGIDKLEALLAHTAV